MDKGMRRNRERWSYDTFLSFRGEDVRWTFVSHLYAGLAKGGIYTFKDDAELKGGESISSELKNAIRSSNILIVVFSKNYASSSWCLDELSEIMKCRKSGSGQTVLPIFYGVEPSEVRRQTGLFGVHLDKHKRRHSENKVREWKEALTEVANLAGFAWANYMDEAKLILDVTTELFKRVRKSSMHLSMHLPTYAVGLKPRVHRISELMCFDSVEPQIIGIYGMGGSGKTTLAKAAFNEFSDLFEGTSFLENFGEISNKPEGKRRLQKQILSDILRRDEKVFHMDHAMKQRFRSKTVLLVIDDVEKKKQLDAIAIDLSCFGPGSRIIITSRNKHLFKELRVENTYSPKELDDGESLELISWHAFRTAVPLEGFLQLSQKLVEYCGGLPLAMEVLGAYLFNRSISQWDCTLQSLKKIPNDNIQAKLQISFGGLDQAQKAIFLDISCFFIGMEKDYVHCILDGCKLFSEMGLSVLEERCLITIRDNKIMMHNLLRDMGRNIVQGAFPYNCEEWSRLWDHENVVEVLANNYGIKPTEGLSLMAEDTNAENLKAKAFSNLPKLRLLQLSNVSLNGSYKHFPKNLRWFYWLGCPLESVPTNFHLRNLVVMDMQHSKLKRLWEDQEQPQILHNLKHLNLSHSVHLTETPNFTYLPNLEKLLLINCKSLVMVHKSIGTLREKLVLLNLKDCSELGNLPLELSTLKSLKTLILSGCSKLEILDNALRKLENLEELSLEGCNGLWKDRNYNCSENSPRPSVPLPFSLNGLNSLKTLRLGFCSLSDELVPEHLGSLSCLEELDLQGNNFRNLQTDFAGHLSLQILKLDSCEKLESMVSVPKKLRSFYARNCKLLERTPDLSECLGLQSLHLTNCYSLVETPGLDKLPVVGVIHMEMCKRIPNAYKERIMKCWAVGANGGIFMPGYSFPDGVSFKNETNSISFTVPVTLKLDPAGFTVWAPYMSRQNNVMSEYSPKITLKNKTKGTVWSRNPATDPIRMYHERHIWQGHFSNEDFFLESGDQVEVVVDFGDQLTILGTELTLAYRKEDTDSSDTHTSYIGHGETTDQQLIQTEAGVMEESLNTPRNFNMASLQEEVQRTSKSCPEASKIRQHPLRDIPLFDRLYNKFIISVSEDRQHQDGPSQLPKTTEPEEVEFEEIPSLLRMHEDNQNTQTHAPTETQDKLTKSRPSRKSPNQDHRDRITSTLENQEKFWSAGRKSFDSFNPFSCAICNEEMLKMSTLDHDGELYWMALDYLAGNENSRQIFMTLPSEQQKIKYLERITGMKN